MSTTVADYSCAIAGRFLAELKNEYKRLEQLSFPADALLMGRQEADYHIKGRNHEDILSKVPLHNYLPATYKLLTDRTLNTIYDHVLSEEAQIPFITAGGYHMIKALVYTDPSISQFLRPIAQQLAEYVQTEIARLDAIPYVEQKTQEWLRIRENMISASVAGYFDGIESGYGNSKEYSSIKEKAGLATKSKIGWGVGSIRHGMTFEDLSGALYNLFNRVLSKEYGILPDKIHSCIGASPDGIIIDVVDREDWRNLRRMGRMREIKNPTDRLINERVPSQYYWQMVQQMYVCRLPLCDFIQTSFIYPNECDPATFINDVIEINPAELTQLDDLFRLFGPESVLLEKLDWSAIGKIFANYSLDDPSLGCNVAKYSIEHWEELSVIPMANINRSGQIKGVLWCFTQPDSLGGTDFEVLFMPPDIAICTPDQIKQFFSCHAPAIISRGYKLETTYYWSCAKYLDYEVEYNQDLYEYEKGNGHGVLGRLLERWALVERLRALPAGPEREAEYYKAYPGDVKKTQKKVSTSNNGIAEQSESYPYKRRAKPVKSKVPELDLS
jgi:hypothetical protein